MTHKLTAFVPAGVLLVGVLLVSGMRQQYVTPSVQPMSALPATFAGLSGRDNPIDSAERVIAGMSDFMYRDFRSDSASKFTIYVGYYDRQVQGKTIHSPKNCLPGAGWEVMENKRIALGAAGNAEGTRAVLSNNGTRALVYYWYQGRGRVEANEYQVKWDLLRDAALYGRTEEALVRIVIPLPPLPANGGPDVGLAAADSLAREISAPLVDAVNRVLPPLRRS